MNEIFKDDHWYDNGEKINSQENLKKVKDCLENSSIIVQHWHYRGASSPDRLLIESFDQYVEYLSKNVNPGDILEIWSFVSSCKTENILVDGKYPDNKGR